MTTEYGYTLAELDYCSGVMGVPITFLDKYNPDQFEILGMTKTPICYENAAKARRVKTYIDVVQVSRDGKESSGNKVNDGSAIVVSEQPEDSTYYVAPGVEGYLIAQYPRILISSRQSVIAETF